MRSNIGMWRDRGQRGTQLYCRRVHATPGVRRPSVGSLYKDEKKEVCSRRADRKRAGESRLSLRSVQQVRVGMDLLCTTERLNSYFFRYNTLCHRNTKLCWDI